MWSLSHATVQPDSQTLNLAKKSFADLLQRKDLGFWQMPARKDLWQQSAARAKDLMQNYRRLVVLGIGGSALGGRALHRALENFTPEREIVFIDNIDASRFWAWLESLTDLEHTHWAIISKSGNTVETLTMAEFVDQYLKKKGLPGIAPHSTVISESKENPLTHWARKESVPCLELSVDVGGRFSVLTPVGLLPAAFYGIDVEEMRKGAEWALRAESLVADLTAQTLASFKREEWVTLFWSYADGLRDWGLWTQQLWAESLAKKTDRTGAPAPRVSTPVPAVGTTDQHSILQQVMEGYPDKFVWFFRVKKSEANGPRLEKNLFAGQELILHKNMGDLFAAEAVATARALKEVGVESLTLQTESLTAASIGALFMLLELVVGSLGEALNINAFNQPGVELGKRLAREILKN